MIFAVQLAAALGSPIDHVGRLRSWPPVGQGCPGLAALSFGGLFCMSSACGRCRRQIDLFKKRDAARCKSKNYLNKSISTGSPTLMKNLANAWDKCSL